MSPPGPARCGHARADAVRSVCNHPGCYNSLRAEETRARSIEGELGDFATRLGVVNPIQGEAAEETFVVDDLPRPPGKPRRPTVRDDVEALADAPAYLRAMAKATPGTSPARLRRYADHLDDLLDRCGGYEPWKVYLLMAAIFTTGMAAGVVAAMAVISR